MAEDSAPSIEIDAEPTEGNRSGPTGTSGRAFDGKTMPHASVDWMLGFDEGRQRGAADVLEALEASLVAVGVAADVAAVIVARVRARAEAEKNER